MSEQKIKVTIIDDERDTLTLLNNFLSRKKAYEIKTYSSPLSALSYISKDTDIILLDVMMPQINGIELLPKLKKKYPNAKVIIMTASSTLRIVLDAQRHGAIDYIMKPFESLEIITNKIDEIL
ncbi:MAG: response regulator [Campylobacterota bacterium]|nr:response regulator [Campylobacterota bacterium]